MVFQIHFKRGANSKIENEDLPCLQKLWNNFARWSNFQIGTVFKYKFSKFLDFEFDLNFKGIQTFWEKSQKFSKIMICQGMIK
jgi:hypothetical protein